MGQWADELRQKANLKVFKHYAEGKATTPLQLLDYDVVIITHQTLANEYRIVRNSEQEGGRMTPCGSVKWHRLVVDESHVAKNWATDQTRACAAIESDRR